jgi:hypothetical protein
MKFVSLMVLANSCTKSMPPPPALPGGFGMGFADATNYGFMDSKLFEGGKARGSRKFPVLFPFADDGGY